MAKVKICSTCGMEFIAKRKDQVYCSKDGIYSYGKIVQAMERGEIE